MPAGNALKGATIVTWLVLTISLLLPAPDAAGHERWDPNEPLVCEQQGLCANFLRQSHLYVLDPVDRRHGKANRPIEVWAGMLGTLWAHQWLLALQVADPAASKDRIERLRALRADLYRFIEAVAHSAGFHEQDKRAPQRFKHPGLRPNSPSRVTDATQAFHSATVDETWWMNSPAMEDDAVRKARMHVVDQLLSLRSSTQGANFEIPSVFEVFIEPRDGFLKLTGLWDKHRGKPTLTALSVVKVPCSTPGFDRFDKDLPGPCFLGRIADAGIKWLTDTSDKRAKYINDVWMYLKYTNSVRTVDQTRYFIFRAMHTDNYRTEKDIYMRTDGSWLGLKLNGQLVENFRKRN